VSPQQILTTAMTPIVVDGSTENAEPHFDLFFYYNINVKKTFFTERELKKGIA